MRDLTSRLREIVRRESASKLSTSGLGEGQAGGTGRPALPRELTYIPDPEAPGPRVGIAAALGGVNVDDAGACVMVERRYDGSRSHGRHRIESCVPCADAPIHLFDSRVQAVEGWFRRTVYFDIETTGLSGGAGTVAFLAGCGWFDGGDFIVRQFLLVGPSGEKPMLRALTDVFGDASLLVSFNGKSFDVPFMETRWAFHRSSPPTDDLPHFDMLPPARRLWSRRGLTVAEGVGWSEPESEGCSLTALERRVLGFHRQDDVPGFEIPARYFHFLRTGDARAIEGVVDHNRHDIVSLAVVMSHALWLLREGPDACREPGELMGLGRIYERADRAGDAVGAYSGPRPATMRWWPRMHSGGLVCCSGGRNGTRRLRLPGSGSSIYPLGDRRRCAPIVRRAVEALAIHHEHRARDSRDRPPVCRRTGCVGYRAGEGSHHTPHRTHRPQASSDRHGDAESARRPRQLEQRQSELRWSDRRVTGGVCRVLTRIKRLCSPVATVFITHTRIQSSAPAGGVWSGVCEVM